MTAAVRVRRMLFVRFVVALLLPLASYSHGWSQYVCAGFVLLTWAGTSGLLGTTLRKGSGRAAPGASLTFSGVSSPV